MTAPYVHPDFLFYLFALISYIPTAMMTERSTGTIVYMHRFLVYNLLIQVIFTILCLIVGISQIAAGLWPMVFVDMVIECMKEPDRARQFCCLPVHFKSKYHPLAIAVLFSVFIGPQITFFIGLALGYAHAYGLLARIQIGLATACAWEKKLCFPKLTDKPCKFLLKNF